MSVLGEDYILAMEIDREEENVENWLPFSGPRQLPTKNQVLKLYLYWRDLAGLRNGWTTTKDVTEIVCFEVEKYWKKAGFQTKKRSVEDVQSLVDGYLSLKKKSGRKSKAEEARRLRCLEDLDCLFDIAVKNLKDILSADRIRANLDIEGEDLAFLEDQQTRRQMVLGSENTPYKERVASEIETEAREAETTTASGKENNWIRQLDPMPLLTISSFSRNWMSTKKYRLTCC